MLSAAATVALQIPSFLPLSSGKSLPPVISTLRTLNLSIGPPTFSALHISRQETNCLEAAPGDISIRSYFWWIARCLTHLDFVFTFLTLTLLPSRRFPSSTVKEEFLGLACYRGLKEAVYSCWVKHMLLMVWGFKLQIDNGHRQIHAYKSIYTYACICERVCVHMYPFVCTFVHLCLNIDTQ